MLYLDNSATTPILPEVKDKMITYLSEEYGNPSGKYYDLAINAEAAVKEARKQLSKLLNADEKEVIFTSGATESNNILLKGVAHYYSSQGKHIITSKAEHSAVLEVCEYLEENGFEVTYLDVDQFGRINSEELKNAIRQDTILVSIIWGNNELGSLNDIEAIAHVCEGKGVFLHTDATQVVGKIPLSWKDIKGLSFLSCSAHKMHGPKGVGALVIRKDRYGKLIPLTPLFHGGGQEEGIRSGTYSVHNIVGMGEAARIANNNLEKNTKHLTLLEDRLIEILTEKFSDNITFNSDRTNKIPGVINVRFIGLNNEVLLKKLSPIIAASTGSACSSAKPSHVLQAIGLDLKEVRESIRFSFSPYTNMEDVNIFKEL
ncbi:cysteine desulfurase IscS [Thalassobacillus devorans]|uniref:Cysteine desulfurase IscS n=1 Tax=Thalassobacillus devorans TaxID=279813 RepID=A0ABQ1NGL5_9BACI|nr:cysteine desulfurase family protein [Thalassobacillus devorans]NIK27295.1 cysteine desulfurase [Thalassobacillus devorans]GGC76542.1 cysteine desulfurase IscS [Thalassobacillus devorans]